MKRRNSESPDRGESLKRPRVEQNLLNLSDDVLLNVFKHNSSFDKFNLHLCCTRLSQLCCDRTLWNKLDLRKQCLSSESIEKFFKFLQRSTQLVAIRGSEDNAKEHPELSIDFFKALGEKCEQLKELYVENYRIFQDKIKITDFPSTLQVLSLQGTEVLPVQSNKSFLSDIADHMTNLTSLILSNCDWFNPYSIMAISKAYNLRELRVNSCHSLGDCMAYVALATRCGFKNLQIADFRDTFLGDSELTAFSNVESLTELYLECPKAPDMIRQPDEEPTNQRVIHIRFGQEPQIEERRVNVVHVAPTLVTDRAIYNLGDWRGGQVIIRQIENRFMIVNPHLEDSMKTNPNLRKLVLRNYKGITNNSLIHLAQNVAKIDYLDVTGTSVTREGIQGFKNRKPDVKVISSFD